MHIFWSTWHGGTNAWAGGSIEEDVEALLQRAGVEWSSSSRRMLGIPTRTIIDRWLWPATRNFSCHAVVPLYNVSKMRKSRLCWVCVCICVCVVDAERLLGIDSSTSCMTPPLKFPFHPFQSVDIWVSTRSYHTYNHHGILIPSFPRSSLAHHAPCRPTPGQQSQSCSNIGSSTIHSSSTRYVHSTT
jgi:hypothetical protein